MNKSKSLRSILLLCYFLTLLIPQLTIGQIKINEFVSSNVTGLTDEDGDYPDWIELYNSSEQTVDLSNYFLSDDLSDTLKWPLPSTTLASKKHMLIFASGKNRFNIVNEWNTIIDKGDELKYIIPDQEPETTWKTADYDDSQWLNGASGIGYGDDDDETIIESCISFFVRKQFTITDFDNIAQAVLHLDYDDGFVAYLNGVEIARDNLGTAGSFVSFDQTADNWEHEAQMYQGLPPNQFEVHNWESILTEGINVLAIQIHNYSNTSSDLSCIPFFSLGLKNSEGHEASEHINLPTSYLHTNFKIKAGGESLYLFKNKVFIDSIQGKKLLADISLGRQTDGDEQWSYFDTPTPGAANIGNSSNELTTDSVQFSIPGGNHQGQLSLVLSNPNKGDSKIYYSTDGSIPDKTSYLFSDEIKINTDTVIRARIMDDGVLAGPVLTQTYILNKQHTLPIISLSTDPNNLWDYQTGIYVKGPNASPDNPFWGANFWQDWEKPAHFEYYDKDGTKQIDQGAGVKIYGAWSRAHPLKSMALFARKEYGDGSFNYKFFQNRDNDKFEALVIRNSGNDFYSTHLRDGLVASIMEPLDIENQGFQPTAIYLNGEYWGILNLREKINEHFISDHTSIRNDSVNILELGGEIVNGNDKAYQELLDFISKNSLTIEENYEKVAEYIDVDNYIDYLLAQTFIDNRDWPGNNIKFWNTTSSKSRYRWIMYDTDFGFGLYDTNNYQYNSLADALASNGPNWPNPPWSTKLFRALKANNKFKAKMAQRANDYLEHYWKPSMMNEKIDSLKNIYSEEMKAHCDRWDLDYTHWSNEVARLKTFSNYRPRHFEQHVKDILGFDDEHYLSVDVSSSEGGHIIINDITINDYPHSASFYSNHLTRIHAVPRPGYRFVKWEGDLSYSKAEWDFYLNTQRSQTAVFEAASEDDVSIVINEVFYKSSETIKPGDWIELCNEGKTSVNLKDWVFSDTQEDSAFVIPHDILLAPKAYFVVCKDKVKFKTTYPMVNNVVGDFEFGLSSSGDYLRLYNSDGDLVDAVDYYPNGDWPDEANGQGASIELLSPSEKNELGENWEASQDGGTPGDPNRAYDDVGIFNPTTQLNADLQCLPNPVHNSATIQFTAEQTEEYQLELLNIDGTKIETIRHEVFHADQHTIMWTGASNLNNGIYLLRLSSIQGQECIKIIIIN
ncbi:CotH kinase family protein [Carboxylicivirga sp. N1Y90]|uniref:CotH kinase family protein n=1 Tax=Carboxylicivirga fragile TaxID=3417571 RepID=UPI003D325023|nr:CotH kinase family protein [Marinilabiliaceae bacterium N1Y90]